ncbi:hypothetical protein GGS24DRAFT_501412 [Hypoxylon argillaceum]|nr:hypothetical protein GGS24DRAFT_501412 [Hypoxylon argillaceum]
MDSSLHEIWHTASGSAFEPAVGKGNQFLVGFVLLLLGLGLTGGFAFNRSLVNLPIYGVPAGLAIACVLNPYNQLYSLLFLLKSNLLSSFGTVYMFCAVGVYV